MVYFHLYGYMIPILTLIMFHAFLFCCACYFVGVTVPVCFPPTGSGSGYDGKYSVRRIWTAIKLHH